MNKVEVLTKLAKLASIEYMQVVSIRQAKVNFYKLIEKVIKGEGIIITKYGKPVVKLEPYNEE